MGTCNYTYTNAGRRSRANSTALKGEIPMERMLTASKNTISFSKTVSVTPDGYLTESSRKKELESLIDRYKITEAVVYMYRDKAGQNDLKRMQELGFEIQAHSSEEYEGTERPPKDYYYMKRK